MLPFTEEEYKEIEIPTIKKVGKEFSNGGVYYLLPTLWKNIFIAQNVKSKKPHLVKKNNESNYEMIYEINSHIT